jgi:hypothetical protein
MLIQMSVGIELIYELGALTLYVTKESLGAIAPVVFIDRLLC